MSEKSGPLKGIRVLDLSRVLAGPTATQILGDYGADVLKIERPGRGDDTRAWGPPFLQNADGSEAAESAYYLCVNRNKRSVAVDIATTEGADQIRALLADCDILVENFKCGGLAKYALGYEDLKAEFPGLIYCSITGFGQTGPNAHRAGYDLLAQGYSGLMSLTGEAQGAPMKVGVGIGDVLTGLYATTAILAALHHKRLTGQGQHIDLSLVDCLMAGLVNEGTNYLLSGQSPTRFGNAHPNIVPYQVFAVADGHAIVAVGNDGQFARFCDLLGQPDLAHDPRYATNSARLEHREGLLQHLSDMLIIWRKDDLIAAMEARGIPGGPINTVPELFETEQVTAREMVVQVENPAAQGGMVSVVGNPVKFSQTPVRYDIAPPRCGAHTEEVFEQFGLESPLQD